MLICLWENKQKVPSTLYFYRFIANDSPAWLRGGAITTNLTGLKSVTDGAISISINGSIINATGIDLSSATSLSSVAQAIQAKLTDTSVVYNSNFNAIIITSSTIGETSSVLYPVVPSSGTDLSAMLNLYEENGAIVSAGVNAQTLTQTLQNLVTNTQNWFSFMPVFDENETQKEELAEWVNSKGTRFLYIANETNANALIANNVSCFAQEKIDYYGIFNAYNTKEFCAFVSGFVASIDWERTNGRKTLAYRSQAGLQATITTQENANALLSNGYNFYGAYATASEDFILAQNGQVSGQAKWLDTYAGQVWLRSGLQAAWLTVLKNANTLPFNDDGYSAIYSGSLDIINTAVNAGVIVQGVTLSQEQKDQVQREAGLDISETLFNKGWYLQIPNVTSQTRVARGPLKPNFWYCDGGSVQKIEGTATNIL